MCQFTYITISKKQKWAPKAKIWTGQKQFSPILKILICVCMFVCVGGVGGGWELTTIHLK